jgi:hypothetical protein
MSKNENGVPCRDDDGGPVYPLVVPDDDCKQHVQFGLSLRDYFAAKVVTAMLSHTNVDHDPQMTACAAYLYADAMLRESNKRFLAECPKCQGHGMVGMETRAEICQRCGGSGRQA